MRYSEIGLKTPEGRENPDDTPLPHPISWPIGVMMPHTGNRYGLRPPITTTLGGVEFTKCQSTRTWAFLAPSKS